MFIGDGSGKRIKLSRTANNAFSSHKRRIVLVMVLLLSVTAMSVLMTGSENTDAAAISAGDVTNAIASLADGDTYIFTGEPDDTVALVLSDGKNRIIDGGGLALSPNSGKRHFNITNTGTGTITFINMNLTNPGAYANSGGISISGGTYVFENCTFAGLTNTAVVFNGVGNDAKFADCTFIDNPNRAVILSGGHAGDITEYYFIDCLFQRNKVTVNYSNGEGGGAIYVKGHSYLTINVEGCVFTENKAIGTNTGIGGGPNKRVDGGAMYINADGRSDCELNISDSYFEKNFAQDDGGAIIVEGTKTSASIKSNIVNCTFFENTVAGAHYGGSFLSFNFVVTDGSGGAICYFGLTDSEITHCTFYRNGITNTLPAGVTATNFGCVGGGGAIGVDTDPLYITDAATLKNLPPVPKLTNNIFVGNYVTNPAPQSSIDLINSVTGNGLGNMKERSGTGNVYVLNMADADYQATLWDLDPRVLQNNGNIGYDCGKYDINGNEKTNFGYKNVGIDKTGGIIVENIFADFVSNGNTGDDDDPNDAVPARYGDSVGAAGGTVYRNCFIPGPTSDELYRDGSVPYAVEVPLDTLGNQRDTFPNAGAVEIYWSMFNPGSNANWTGAVPMEVEDPTDPSLKYKVIESLRFDTNNGYYVMTALGVPNDPSGFIIAMPRSAITHSDPAYGFLGWRSDLPDLNWGGYAQWAADNGYSYATMEIFLQNLPPADLPIDAFPLYQPGNVVLSVKQTLTAEWYQFLHRTDFDLNYDTTPNWYSSAEPGKEAPRLNIPAGGTILAPADPIRSGYAFDGWYKESTLQNIWDFTTDTVSDDTVLYAKWTLITYTVTYRNDGSTGGSAPVDGGNPYLPNSDVTVLGSGTLSRTSHTFDGWSVTFGDTSPVYREGDSFTISANVDLYPVWVKNIGGNKEYCIFASADNGSYIDPAGYVTVSGGGDRTFTFGPLSGNELKSVTIDGQEYLEPPNATSYTFHNVNMNHTISVASVRAEGGGIGGSDLEVDPPGTDGTDSGGENWAVLNLICAVIALIAGMIASVKGRNRIMKDESGADEKNGEIPGSKIALALRVIGLIAGIAAMVVFFLTEDYTLPAAFVDGWSPLMVVLLLASLVVSFVSFRFDKKDERN